MQALEHKFYVRFGNNFMLSIPSIHTLSKLPATAKHFRISASNSNNGTARGTRVFDIIEYTGEEVGKTPYK